MSESAGFLNVIVVLLGLPITVTLLVLIIFSIQSLAEQLLGGNRL